jgi:hypothetical protein
MQRTGRCMCKPIRIEPTSDWRKIAKRHKGKPGDKFGASQSQPCNTSCGRPTETKNSNLLGLSSHFVVRPHSRIDSAG